MQRFIVVRLCDLLWNDSDKIRNLIGMCEEHYSLKNHAFFTNSRRMFSKSGVVLYKYLESIKKVDECTNDSRVKVHCVMAALERLGEAEQRQMEVTGADAANLLRNSEMLKIFLIDCFCAAFLLVFDPKSVFVDAPLIQSFVGLVYHAAVMGWLARDPYGQYNQDSFGHLSSIELSKDLYFDRNSRVSLFSKEPRTSKKLVYMLYRLKRYLAGRSRYVPHIISPFEARMDEVLSLDRNTPTPEPWGRSTQERSLLALALLHDKRVLPPLFERVWIDCFALEEAEMVEKRNWRYVNEWNDSYKRKDWN